MFYGCSKLLCLWQFVNWGSVSTVIDFSLLRDVETASRVGVHPASFSMNIRPSFPGLQGRVMKLNSDLRLVPKLMH